MIKIMKIALFVILTIVYGTTFAQNATLNGEIKGMGDGEVNIYYFEDDVARTDNVKVTKDKFTWKANLPYPQKVWVSFPKGRMWIFAESGNMTMSGHIDSLKGITLNGSKIQDEANAYAKLSAPLNALRTSILQRYGKGSKEEQLVVEKQWKDYGNQALAFENKYISEHLNSALSLSLLAERVQANYVEMQSVFNKLSKNLKDSPEGQRLVKRLEVLKHREIGEPMLNFTQANAEGQPVSFSDFKGKYVLIDFWASWCGPCRAENPNVLKAYNTYKDKNFTVIGVSLDDNGDKWKKAIKEDGIPWTQVSDLKGSNNEIAAYFGINSIPSTLLIDPQGKIIDKDLRGELLNKKLSDLLGGK